MVDMKVSIAMATYNGAKYIQEQLDSLSNQSLLPFELVVCDDGSTDDTLPIVREYAKSAPFLVRIYQNEENLHFTGNFFKVASLCNGNTIAFCDQDDIWDKRKIEACLAALQSEDADLLIHEGRVVDSAGRLTPTKIPNLSVNFERINKAPFDHASKGFAMVMRRLVIEEFMACWDWAEYVEFKARYGAPAGHDLLIYAWCVGRKKIGFLRQELVRYRVHGENVTANVSITNNRATKFLNFFRGLATNKLDYYLPAQKWAAEAEFLRSYMRRSSVEQKPGLEQLAGWLARQSKLWLDRSAIYDKQSSRTARWLKLAGILKTGGYLSRQEPRLGIKSLSKDLVVASIY
jgi:glycosyltransferase involved in cell wall biosynthesis